MILRFHCKYLLFLFCITLFFVINVYGESSGNFFVATKSTKVNLRNGPGTNYPIKYVYIKKMIPLKAVDTFDSWLHVEDIDGSDGWVLRNIVTLRISKVMLTENAIARKHNDENAKSVMILDKFALINLDKCTQDWCRISYNKTKGWVRKNILWGVN